MDPDTFVCMCGQEKSKISSVAVKLTGDERDELRRMGDGETPPTTLYYCQACWNLLQDPEPASQLMKGMAQQYLQQAGLSHSEAERMAEEYRQKLLKRARETKNAPSKP